MKKQWIVVVGIFGFFIAVFLVLGVIGRYDFAYQVLCTMSQEDYEQAKELLTEQNGEEPSDFYIATWWVENQNK